MIHKLKMSDNQLLATSMTAAATATSNFDCMGADWATILISFHAEANTSAVGPTLSVLESDDTTATNFATITANRTAEDLTAKKLVKYEVDLRARKRYLRLSVTTATHTTNDVVTVHAIGTLSRLGDAPSSTSDMVASTNDVVVLVT